MASGGGPKSRAQANTILARNRKARHTYAIDEICEAGLALVDSEVKSIRNGKVALVDAYAVIEKNEAWLCELEIGVYVCAHARNHDPRRRRKLLHRTLREGGTCLVPAEQRLCFHRSGSRPGPDVVQVFMDGARLHIRTGFGPQHGAKVFEDLLLDKAPEPAPK